MIITQKYLKFYGRGKPTINAVNFNAANASTNSFNVKEKKTDKEGNNGKTNVEIMVPLKHLRNFCRTLEMLLILQVTYY